MAPSVAQATHVSDPRVAVSVYVMKRAQGGYAVVLSKAGIINDWETSAVKTVASCKSQERATRFAQAVVDGLHFMNPDAEVLGPVQGSP
jgi:hypothetical protein